MSVVKCLGREKGAGRLTAARMGSVGMISETASVDTRVLGLYVIASVVFCLLSVVGEGMVSGFIDGMCPGSSDNLLIMDCARV